MKLLSSFFFLWILNIHYKTITAQGEFPALTIVHDGLVGFDIIDNVTMIRDEFFKFVILACPLEDLDLKGKIKENTENQLESSLAIVKIYETKSEIKDGNICKTKIKPNVMHRYGKKSFTFGYKLYLSDDQIDLITKLLKDVNDGSKSEPRKGINDQLMKTDQPNFFWYVVTNIDIVSKQTIIADHRVDTHNYKKERDLKKCENYNLGLSFLEDKNIAEIYEKDFQNSVLNQFKKPNPKEIEINEMQLVEQQLTPIDDFDSRNERMATCSYVNVGPMWTTIANGNFKKVENFIKDIADYTPIEITSGTYGILKLSEITNPDQKKEVLLKNTVVPEVYWKLVKYYDHNEEKTHYLRNGMLVFTYNYVSKSVPHTLLCAENICKKSGWDEVDNDDYKTGLTYCCSPKEDLLKKLGLQGITTLDDLILEKRDITEEVKKGVEELKDQ